MIALKLMGVVAGGMLLVIPLVPHGRNLFLAPVARIWYAYVRQPLLTRFLLACFAVGGWTWGGAKNAPPRMSRLALPTADATTGVNVFPADTNRIAFVRIGHDATTSNTAFTLYSPWPVPVDIFGKSRLESGGWVYLGAIDVVQTFTDVSICTGYSSYFFAAARADVDSDSDGIPDGKEVFLFHTIPRLWDSSGDGLSDWEKVFQFHLDPLSRDTDGDGYDDDEELALRQPADEFTEGAEASIRYVYDEDGRLVGTYSGAGQGAATATVSPAGNPSVLHDRGTR